MAVLIASGFFAVAGIGIFIYGIVRGRDPEWLARTIAAEMARREEKRDPYAEKLREPLMRRIVYPALKNIGRYLASVAPSGLMAKYRQTVDMAGRPGGMTAEAYIGLKLVVLALGMVGAAMTWKAVSHHKFGLTLTMVPLMLSVLGPEMWMRRRIQQRLKEFARAFPDVLDLLSLSVEAGLGLDGAVQEVVKRRDDVAGEELARVLAEIRLGTPRALAWKHLAERMPAYEVSTFVAAIIQAEQLGTSITQVLRAQSEAVRMRRSMAVREAAGKIPVKLLFPLIFFIFPCVFVVILGPGAIRVARTFAHL
ncbi:MAG: type II secretion system F family protein [Armatimonadetes bacterium]|nr:type II secretion system F family protein [Armatimonadota bacterium]